MRILAAALAMLILVSCAADPVANGGNTMTKTNTIISSFTTKEIKLTDAYGVNALNKEIDYLLSLDNEKLLSNFRKNGGQDTKGIEPYNGWENSLIGGHTMGHYLTALAQACTNSGTSNADKTKLYEKLTYLIDELAKCQRENGLLWGANILVLNNLEIQFDNVEKGKSNLFTEAWVPWYTMHKIFEGLIYTYEFTGYEPALDIAKKLGDWVYNRVTAWSEETRRTTLGIEYGGMNEILYELYHVTGEDKYAVAAHQFDEDWLFEQIRNDGANVLNNRHANTTIPKIFGALKRYEYCHGQRIDGKKVDASDYLKTAEVFWQMVVDHHTYATGANSEWEHFGEDDVLNRERTNCNCETCNVYNMLKLTRELFKITGDIKYANYYENAFINDIMASQNPETGMTTYFQAMATGYFKTYSTPYDSFWCCTGSGMENQSKLGDSVYFHDGDSLYVNMYLSTELNWAEKGLKLTQDTNIPETDKSTFKLSLSEPTKLAFKLRIPHWAKGDMSVTLNGETVAYEAVGGYAVIDREWVNGDKLEVTIPLGFTCTNLQDGLHTVAFHYGPVLLAAELGNENMTTTYTGMSVLIPEKSVLENDTVTLKEGLTVKTVRENPDDHFTKVDGLTFKFTAGEKELTFSPYYLFYNQRYGIYFKLVAEK